MAKKKKKLTEEDIRNWSGPEEDYMNEDQLAFFKDLLLSIQDDIINKANRTTEYLQQQ